jgi:hypothetical protein
VASSADLASGDISQLAVCNKPKPNTI